MVEINGTTVYLNLLAVTAQLLAVSFRSKLFDTQSTVLSTIDELRFMSTLKQKYTK